MSVPVAKVSEIPAGTTKTITVDDVPVLLCNVDGTIYAVEDVCTHDGGELDQGRLDGACVECPRHGARFDVRSGAATQLPAFEPVETHAVRLEGDSVQVGVEHQ